MRRKYVIVASIMLIASFLQAKEKTLEEQLEAARKNSEIFVKKAGAFQESFGKDSVIKEGEKKSDYCKGVIYPPTAETFVKYACKAFQDMNWDEVYCYSSKEYLDKLMMKVEMLKADINSYQKKSKTFTCKVKSSKQTDAFWEVKEFALEKMGTIKIDYIGDWKIIGLELN